MAASALAQDDDTATLRAEGLRRRAGRSFYRDAASIKRYLHGKLALVIKSKKGPPRSLGKATGRRLSERRHEPGPTRPCLAMVAAMTTQWQP